MSQPAKQLVGGELTRLKMKQAAQLASTAKKVEWVPVSVVVDKAETAEETVGKCGQKL